MPASETRNHWPFKISTVHGGGIPSGQLIATAADELEVDRRGEESYVRAARNVLTELRYSSNAALFIFNFNFDFAVAMLAHDYRLQTNRWFRFYLCMSF